MCTRMHALTGFAESISPILRRCILFFCVWELLPKKLHLFVLVVVYLCWFALACVDLYRYFTVFHCSLLWFHWCLLRFLRFSLSFHNCSLLICRWLLLSHRFLWFLDWSFWWHVPGSMVFDVAAPSKTYRFLLKPHIIFFKSLSTWLRAVIVGFQLQFSFLLHLFS